MIIFDFEANIIDVNPTALEVLGYSHNEIFAFKVTDFIHQDHLNRFRKVIEDLKLMIYQTEPVEFEMKKKDGSFIWLESMGSLLVKEKKPYAIQAVARDISEFKATEMEQEQTIQKMTYDMVRLEKMLEPKKEFEKDKEQRYVLKERKSYLVENPHIDLALTIFQDMVHHGTHGLAITRHSPQAYRQAYDIEHTPFVWLTTNVIEDEVCINPSMISKISSAIMTFLKKTERGFVLFSGVEYLVAQNGFKSVFNLICLLNDKIMARTDTMLVSINPDAFSTQEINMIWSELHAFSIEKE